MSEDKKARPRKFKFIDSPQQVKFAVEIGLHALLFPIVVMFFLYLEPFAQYLTRGNVADSQAVIDGFIGLCIDNWWIPLGSLFLVAVMSVLFSHKLFGPIVRLERNIERLQQGESHVSFNLRPGDYFQRFATILGEYIASGSAQAEDVDDAKSS